MKKTYSFGRSWFSAFLMVSCFFVFLGAAWADPCGMVPPIYTGQGVPIKRVGPQKTYVFYKNGIESIVLRPGFVGKVSNFGMLIPFPSPPAIRKMPDNIFSHITAAIDPPEVSVRIYKRRWYHRFKSMFRGRRSRMSKSAPAAAKKDEVRVLRKEAVGMYQVAVLQAGSPKALKKWMDSHGYKYPKGMDKVVLDYIQQKWTFVAVKTRVSGKKNLKPRAGMKSAKGNFALGRNFRGAVQAMGFRFHTKKLVVPMRLSAFNAGRLRNIVYILTDGPRRIRSIPTKYVVRQLSGKELYHNITKLLPLRVYGGKPSEIKKHRWASIQSRRNPKPHNGLARVLFASDLLAVKKGKLFLPYEEKKKVLLRIGERLWLRGAIIDKLNREVLKADQEKAARQALHLLKRMTLTVVDGDFSRKVIAKDNLQFQNYAMSAASNNQRKYHARMMRGMYSWQGKSGFFTKWQGPKHAKVNPYPKLFIPKLNKKRKVSASNIYAMIKDFENADKVDQLVRALTSLKQQSVPFLWGEAKEGTSLVRRGWSVVALAEMNQPKLIKKFVELHGDYKQPILLRTWAMAAHLKVIPSFDELLKQQRKLYSFPATRRTFRLKAMELMRGRKAKLAELLSMASNYQLRAIVTPILMKADPKKLVDLMIRHKNMSVRRYAASYLATIGRKQPKLVQKYVVGAYMFYHGATQVPWNGGPLYVPSVQWNRSNARELTHHLLSWMVWAHNHKKTAQHRQIHNNLRSLSFARYAGYRSPGWYQVDVYRWLKIWASTAGCKGVKKILNQQRLTFSERQSYLSRSGCR